MKFETSRILIHLLSDVFICCHPEILPEGSGKTTVQECKKSTSVDECRSKSPLLKLPIMYTGRAFQLIFSQHLLSSYGNLFILLKSKVAEKNVLN